MPRCSDRLRELGEASLSTELRFQVQVNLVDLPELAGLGEVVPFEELRHAALLHADLDDPVAFLRCADDGLPFLELVCERFLNVDVLARLASIDRHRDVPVIRRRDQDRIDIFSIQNFPDTPWWQTPWARQSP